MKSFVLTSLVFATFLLKINAQDNKTQPNNESESKYEKLKVNSFQVPDKSNNLNVQKIKRAYESNSDFSVTNFSSEQISEAFKSFGTRFKSDKINPNSNAIVDEYKGDDGKFHSKFVPAEASNPNEYVTTTEAQDETTEMSTIEPSQPFNEIDSKEEEENEQLNSSSSGSYGSNETSTGYESTESFKVVYQEPSSEAFGPGYIEIIVPENETRTDEEMRAIIESIRDSVNQASNIGKEEFVTSESVTVPSPTSLDRVDTDVPRGRSVSHRPKSKSKKRYYEKRYSYGRYGKNKKKYKKRSKTRKAIDNNQINDELKEGNKNCTHELHMKQDRRMVNQDFSHQFGLRVYGDPKPVANFPYAYEPIEYAKGYPHWNSSYSEVRKPLFQPDVHQIHGSYYSTVQALSGETPNTFEYRNGPSVSSQFFQRKNEYGPVTFEHSVDHSGPYYEHTSPIHGQKTITLTKEIPVPYPVKIEKEVPYPVYVKVPYDKPYPVIVPKPYKIIHEVLKPYKVHIKVPTPYEVIKHVPKPVKVPVDRPYPVSVPKPYKVTVEKKVPVFVEKKVSYPVHVPVDRPYPVHVSIPKHVPYTVEKRVPITIKVPVDKPYPVYIPKAYAVHVSKPVPRIVEKHVPYPVKVSVRYPVKVHVPYEVVKHIPVYEHSSESHHY